MMFQHEPSHPELPIACAAERQIKEMEQRVRVRNAHQPEFLQAFTEVNDSLRKVLIKKPIYIAAFELITEPERTVSFRVPWFDDKGVLVSTELNDDCF